MRVESRPAADFLIGGIVLVMALAPGCGKAERKGAPAAADAAPAPPTDGSALNLSGRWQVEVAKTLPGPPPVPVVKDVFLETDREGNILAAGVLLTDPGRGGVGAGFRIAPDGRRRLDEIAPLVAMSPGGASVTIDFIPLPHWVPARPRLWRALEGASRRQAARYLLLESVEDDYLIQAGINPSGFLSYAFFSPAYATSRGVDALSAIIHPGAASTLHGFRNLVWDLSGSADFLAMEVHATLSGPEGVMDRLTLKRAGPP